MRVSVERDCVVSQGTLRHGVARVEYYTTIPSPTQWIAVGVLLWNDSEEYGRRPRRMLVGNGRDEEGAIQDLRRRFTDLCRAQETVESREPAKLIESIQDRSQIGQSAATSKLTPVAETTTESEAPTA